MKIVLSRLVEERQAKQELDNQQINQKAEQLVERLAGMDYETAERVLSLVSRKIRARAVVGKN